MKTLVIAFLLLIVIVCPAVAEPIADIQGGLPTLGGLVTPAGVVTAVRDNGLYIAEAPYGAWNGIWIFTDAPHSFVPGDVVQTCGVYEEFGPDLGAPYDGFTQVNVAAAGIYGSVLKVGTDAVPAPTVVPAAALLADMEAWESCVITIPDGIYVDTAADPDGEWPVTTMGGIAFIFDDFWYDSSNIDMNACYNNATGIWHQGPGQPGPGTDSFKFEPFADGIMDADCTVGDEQLAFGALKALYR